MLSNAFRRRTLEGPLRRALRAEYGARTACVFVLSRGGALGVAAIGGDALAVESLGGFDGVVGQDRNASRHHDRDARAACAAAMMSRYCLMCWSGPHMGSAFRRAFALSVSRRPGSCCSRRSAVASSASFSYTRPAAERRITSGSPPMARPMTGVPSAIDSREARPH